MRQQAVSFITKRNMGNPQSSSCSTRYIIDREVDRPPLRIGGAEVAPNATLTGQRNLLSRRRRRRRGKIDR